MYKVRLELDYIEIEKKRERWKLYFILATENPENPDEMVLSVFPAHPIVLRGDNDNKYHFKPTEGDGDLNGLIVMERSLPADRSVKTRLWLMHDKGRARDAGKIMTELSGALKGSKATGAVLKALGDTNPWIAVAGTAFTIAGIMGKFMEKSNDRNLGFSVMDEVFSDAEIQNNPINRKHDIGIAKIEWTWIISPDNT